MENIMYRRLEQLLDLLISGMMSGFVMWMTIVFVHYLYTRWHSTENQFSQKYGSEIPALPATCSLPYSSEILIPITFSILVLLQVQTIVQLRAIARELNLSSYSKQSKPTLIRRIAQEQQRLCFRRAVLP
jgi:Rho termination factor, N-terminal domain